jgi:hypothetical protein
MNSWFFLLIAAFLIFSLFLVLFLFWRKRKKRFSDKDIEFFFDRFLRLEGIVQQDPRFAVLEGDKLIDRALGILGYEGTLSEKLRASERMFRDIHGLWAAHKLRNLIAHEVDHTVSVTEAKNALRAFKVAFRDMGIDFRK